METKHFRRCARFAPYFFAISILSTRIFAEGESNPTGVSGVFNGNITTAGNYDPFTGNKMRIVDDIVVPGSVGAYPLKWTRSHNTRDTYDHGMSSGWNFSYDYAMTADGMLFPDGREISVDTSGVPEQRGSWTDSSGTVHNAILLADGGKVIFDQYIHRYSYKDIYGNTVWVTDTPDRVSKLIDPYGQTTTMTYDDRSFGQDQYGNQNFRMVRVTEPGGRYLQIFWNGPLGWISRVEAHDVNGNLTQWVNYGYTFYDNGHPQAGFNTALTSVTYSDGTGASYTNQSGSGGPSGGPSQLLTCDDVRYHGPMRQISYGSRSENNLISGEAVSTSAQLTTQPTIVKQETRGDGATRTFTYNGSAKNDGHLISYTDFLGHSTSVEYYDSNTDDIYHDRYNFIKSVTDPNGRKTVYVRPLTSPDSFAITSIVHYAADGVTQLDHIDQEYTDYSKPYFLASRTDELGHKTSYTRDANNRITRIDYADGSYETFTYNNFGQVLTHRRKNGAYEHFAYGSTGLLTTKWNPTVNSSPQPSDPKMTYSYYTSGPWTDRVQIETDPRGNPTTYEYDRDSSGNAVASRGLITKIMHADGTYKTFGYDIYGNKLWEENEIRDQNGNGQRTTYTYDSYSRLLSVQNPLGQTTSYSYECTNGSNTSPTLHTTNSVRFETSPTGIVTANGYDANFRKSSTTLGYGTSLAATTTFGYDNVGNPTTATDPLNHTVTTTYDDRNRKSTVTDALNHVTTWHYDVGSNVTSIDRPDGTTETKTYDVMNRMVTDTVPQTATVSLTTTLSYNPSGTIGSVTDAKGQVTSFEYDPADLKTKMTYPNLTDTQTWTYDEAKNLITRKTVNGTTQSFTYDNRNRKTAMSWSNNADSASFVYDAASRLTSATNPTSTVTRQYDAAGRLTLDRQSVGTLGNKDVQYEYDVDGKETRMYLNGTTYDYTFGYDAMGRFEKIFTTGQGTPSFQYYYDAASNETQRFSYANSVAQTYTRDTLNRMSRRDVIRSGNTLSFEAYGYDTMSRLTSIDREDTKRDAFGYDLSGEVNSAQYGLVSGANPNRTVGYDWDKAGNRNIVTENSIPTPYTSNSLNQYNTAGVQPVVNGSEHEIASYTGNVYSYINDERLASVTSLGNSYSLAYDTLGRCVKRTLNGVTTYYVYDGEKPIYEFTSTGGTAGWNLYGKAIDEILMRKDYVAIPAGQTYYYQQDHEGSVTHLTNSSGTVIESYRYDAFGAPTIFDSSLVTHPSSQFNNRFMFTGREYTSIFGFYEYRARAYHPGLGRFMSEDAKGFDAGDYNLFRYVKNDPLDFTDPMGLDAFDIGNGLYRFELRPDVNTSALAGAWVTHPKAEWSKQCAQGMQYLAGTRLQDGRVHEVPKVRTWREGAQVTKQNPPPKNTIIATGWEKGQYPNHPQSYYQKPENQGKVINHVGAFRGFDAKGNVIVFDQHTGKPLGESQRSSEGWHVVTAPQPYETQPSQSQVSALDQNQIFKHGQ